MNKMATSDINSVYDRARGIAATGYVAVMDSTSEELGRLVTHLCSPEMVDHRKTMVPNLTEARDSLRTLHQMTESETLGKRYASLQKLANNLSPLSKELRTIEDPLTAAIGAYLTDLSDVFYLFTNELIKGYTPNPLDLNIGNLTFISSGLASLNDSRESTASFYDANKHLLEDIAN